jgi:hypothetical protein
MSSRASAKRHRVIVLLGTGGGLAMGYLRYIKQRRCGK